MDENNENKKPEENIEENVEEISGNDGVKIANDAIAISEVQGVYGMSGTFAGITEALIGKKNLGKGIKVDADEKSAKIDVNIIVEYGARIPDVAFEIQTRVKKSVETMTGLKVSEVNVHVQGVHAITEKDQEETDSQQ